MLAGATLAVLLVPLGATATPLQLVVEPVVATGDPAPGTGGVFTALGGYSIGDSVNGAGDIAFLGVSDGPGHFVTGGFSGVWVAPTSSGPIPAALRTDEAPGLFSSQGDQLLFSKNFGHPFIGRDGTVAFSDQGRLGALFHPQNGVWAAPIAVGTPAPVALSTDPQFDGAPFDAGAGEPQVRLTSYHDAANAAMLVSNAASGALNQGVFRAGAGTPQAVAVTGAAAPEADGATFAGFEAPVMNRLGETAFLATLGGAGVTAADDLAVFKERNSQLELVAREGDPAPGTNSAFSDFAPILFGGRNGLPTINETGETAFIGEFTETLVFRDREFVFTRDGIWRGTGADDLQLVAREFQATPTAIGPVQFGDFAEPLLAGERRDEFGEIVPSDLVFRAQDNTGVGIWRQRDGVLSPIAQRFQAAPGTEEDEQLFVLFAPTVNSAGDVAFFTQLAGPGVTFTNDLALFAQSADGALTKIAREGEVIDERFGAIRELVSQPFLSGTQEGGPAFLSDAGHLVFAARYDSGVTAIYRAAFENPTTVNFLWNAGCGDGDWHTTCGEGTNWLDADRAMPAQAPPGDNSPSGESARIESAQVTLQQRGATLHNLEVTGEGSGLHVQAPLSLAVDSLIQGLTLESDLTVDGTLFLSGEAQWRGGAIGGGGDVEVSAGIGPDVPRGRLTVTAGDGAKALHLALRNHGDINQQGGAQLLVGADGLLDNRPDGLYEAFDGSSVSGAGRFLNAGRVEAGATDFEVGFDSADGGVVIAAGPVALSGGGRHAGNVVFEARGPAGSFIVGRSGGPETVYAGEAAFRGDGVVLFEGDQRVETGKVAHRMTGPLPGSLSGDLFVAHGAFVNEGKLAVFNPAGPVAIFGSAGDEVGGLRNEGGELRFLGEATLTDALFLNRGIGAAGGLAVQMQNLTLTRSEIRNQAGGVYRFDGDAAIDADDASLFRNDGGTIRKADEGISFAGIPLAFSAGRVEVAAGALYLSQMGRYQGSGTFHVAADAVLGSVVDQRFAGTFDVSGEGTWLGSPRVEGGVTTVNMTGPGLWSIEADPAFTVGAEPGAVARLVNLGEAAWTGGTMLNLENKGGLRIAPRGGAPPARLDGTLANLAGELKIVGDVSGGGAFENAGFALFDKAGGVIAIEPAWRTTSPLGAEVEVAANTSVLLKRADSLQVQLGGFVRLATGEWTLNDGTTLRATPDPDVNGGGALPITQIGADAILTLRGDAQFVNLPTQEKSTLTFMNFGHLALEDGFTWNGDPFSNMPGASLRIGAGAEQIFDVPSIVVSGAAGDDVLADYAVFSGFAGSTTIIDGVMTVVDDPFDAALGFDPDARVQFAAGASLTGSGRINGKLVMDGTFSPGSSPGLFEIDGDFEQGADGRLVIEIAGLLPGAEYDVLEVSGNVMIDGLLDLVFLEGFVPEIDDAFAFLLVGGDLSGSFADVRVFGLGDATFDLAFDPQAGALRLANVQASVAEPGALGLLALALAGLALRRHAIGSRGASSARPARIREPERKTGQHDPLQEG